MCVDAEVSERLAAALAVNDDAIEPAKDALPHRAPGRRTPRQQVVRGEDRGRAEAKQALVELREREPLDVHDVGASREQPEHAERVLDRLERQAQAGAPK